MISTRTRLVRTSGLLLLCSLSAQHAARAHDGALAVAYPLQNVAIDGDLREWPTDMPTYPVALQESGAPPDHDADLKAHFRMGYDADDSTLFVAVEVDDDSHVFDGSPNAFWNTQDGCEVYVDAHHRKRGSQVLQYSRYGDVTEVYGYGAQLDDVELAVARSGTKRTYEWRIRLVSPTTPGRSLGVDVSVGDKDGNNTFSWYAWSPGTGKLSWPGRRCGDLLLVRPDTELGTVTGKIDWKGTPQTPRPRRVRIASPDTPDLWIQAVLEEDGTYDATLPPGPYTVRPVTSVHSRVDESQAVEIDVRSNETTEAPPLVVTPVPLPRLVGEQGVLHGDELDAEAIDHFLRVFMDYYEIPGMSIAIIHKGKIAYQRALGVRSLVTREKVENETVFEAASMTKPVFALAVCRLVERGILDLDTPLYEYLPYPDIDYDERYKQITARMVLCHRSGFPNWRDDRLEIHFTPGTKQMYSGEGFEYLGKVVAHLTKKSLERILDDEVFQLLGVENTYLTWTGDSDTTRTAFPHDRNNAAVRKTHWAEPWMAGCLHIDARNYAKFLLAVLERRELPKEGYDDMLRPQFEVDEKAGDQSFGLGFVVESTPFGKRCGHGGTNRGFTSKSELYLDRGFGYVFLVNNHQAYTFNEVLRAYLVTGRTAAK